LATFFNWRSQVTSFNGRVGSKLNISGGEFRLNGQLVSGLDAVGDMRALDVPETYVLSGTLADGLPFAFSSLDRDRIANGALTLRAAELPPIGLTMIALPGDLAPQGIRADQTLVVDVRGALTDNFHAGWGSTVRITGGQVGKGFEAVGTHVMISNGSVGDAFDAHSGTVVHMTGGEIGRSFRSGTGSEVHISGGVIGESFQALSGSEVNVFGGAVGDFIFVDKDGTVNLFGSQFVLDDIDITASLTLNEPFPIKVRDVMLSGLLADGSAFSFNLKSSVDMYGEPADFFDPGAILTVTLVPEPTTVLVLISLLGITFLRRASSA
ncbi:PEP-CTERM sorting domain-containing protein, partial [Pirellulales bacterium]|nr:PEP-CTERM sorting domain-containing protein [Pirellulales bacterium]